MIGKTISHYKILEKVGEGGMGVVYKAEDTKLKRTVALKFLPHHLLANEEDKTRFLHEAQAVSALNHPNIMTIYEVDEVEDPATEGELFIAMEYLEGETLKDKLGKAPLKTKELLKIAIAVADGLTAAHAKEIIHRDVKSENIMISKDGLTKIMDFGLARRKGETRITKTGSTLGTLAYMSPEQAEGLDVDRRGDLFSFGVVMYEMATVQLPFKGEHEAGILYAIVNEEPLPVSTLNPNVPQELERIIHKALEKEPEDRYQHADDLGADLRKLKKDIETGRTKTITTQIPVVREAEKKPVWRVGAAVIVGILLILGIRFLVKRGAEPTITPGENSLAVLYFENLQNPDDPQRLGQIFQELVIADLSDITSLKVFSSQRLFDIQKQLGSRDRTKIDPELATEIARRAGAGTMLTGTLSQLGGMWILTSQLIDVIGGTVVKSQRIDGSDLYAMVDELSEQVRGDLKLPEVEADKVALTVREKTTASMEAYQHYLEGVDLLNKSEFDSAIVLFNKAVSIDSTFNQAYYKMAIAQWWSVSSGKATVEQAKASLSKILTSKQQPTERDRLLAEGILALVEDRDADGEFIFQRLVDGYPDEKEGWYGLGEAYFHGTGEKLKALDAFERAVHLDAEFKLAYTHIFDIYYGEEMFDRGITRAQQFLDLHPDESLGYVYLGRMLRGKGEFESALEIYERGLFLDPEAYSLISAMGYTFRLMGNYDKAVETYALLAEPDVPPNWWVTGKTQLANLYREQGQYNKALEILDQTRVIARAIGVNREAAIIEDQAASSFFLGDTVTALARLDTALSLEPGTNQLMIAYHWKGIIYARWGQLRSLNSVTDTIWHIIERRGITGDQRLPYNALLIERYTAQGELDKALVEYDNLRQFKPLRDFYRYMQALLHFKKKNYDQALLMTRQMQSPSISFRRYNYPFGFYLRGRIYEEMGELGLARENYKKLLSLWHNADEEIRELQDARKRLSRIMRPQG